MMSIPSLKGSGALVTILTFMYGHYIPACVVRQIKKKRDRIWSHFSGGKSDGRGVGRKGGPAARIRFSEERTGPEVVGGIPVVRQRSHEGEGCSVDMLCRCILLRAMRKGELELYAFQS